MVAILNVEFEPDRSLGKFFLRSRACVHVRHFAPSFLSSSASFLSVLFSLFLFLSFSRCSVFIRLLVPFELTQVTGHKTRQALEVTRVLFCRYMNGYLSLSYYACIYSTWTRLCKIVILLKNLRCKSMLRHFLPEADLFPYVSQNIFCNFNIRDC